MKEVMGSGTLAESQCGACDSMGMRESYEVTEMIITKCVYEETVVLHTTGTAPGSAEATVCFKALRTGGSKHD